MRRTLLRVLNAALTEKGIAYTKGRKRSVDKYPYFVGEIYELGTMDESGRTDFEILLNGFARDGREAGSAEGQLEKDVEMIAELFPATVGAVTNIGNATVAIFYEGAQPIKTDLEELARIEVKLSAKAWKGGEE